MQFFLFLYLSSCRFPYAMSYSVQSIALTFCIRVSRCLSFPDLAQHVPKHVSECPPSIDVILGSDLLKSSSAAVELVREQVVNVSAQASNHSTSAHGGSPDFPQAATETHAHTASMDYRHLAYKDVHAAIPFNDSLRSLAGPSFVPSSSVLPSAPTPVSYVKHEDSAIPFDDSLSPLAGPSMFIPSTPVLPRPPTSHSYLERSFLGHAESGLRCSVFSSSLPLLQRYTLLHGINTHGFNLAVSECVRISSTPQVLS
ncbi:hypothetical protein BDP27DRAFT_1445846 [Rhodocollybia butyracea]|uniref:Uncharacterized protein n=1 Tax=Rhodocollybia butyracea TaxID=206335 RepID=A0A9P5Q234_9AGAR|nr:hypothetical protein BDP27DRAFT_1445846 [Rhodocollybia butyracea]